MAKYKQLKLPYLGYLDESTVIAEYRRQLKVNGYTSCARVAAELSKTIKGRTGSISRQAIHRILAGCEDGRELLNVTKERTGR